MPTIGRGLADEWVIGGTSRHHNSGRLFVMRPTDSRDVDQSVVCERLQDRRKGRWVLDSRRRASPDPPPALLRERHSQIEDRRLAHAPAGPVTRRVLPFECTGTCESAAQQVADISAADQPRPGGLTGGDC
jgi:hypothetical protein